MMISPRPARACVTIRLVGLALAAACLLPSTTHAAPQLEPIDIGRDSVNPVAAQTKLENEDLVFDFRRDGTRFELESITPKADPDSPILMATGSGSWTLRLAAKGVQPMEWFEFSMDGSVCDSTGCANPTLGSLDSLSLDAVRVVQPSARIEAYWSGRITFAGASAGFLIVTDWRVAPGYPFGVTRLSFRLTSPGALPFYATHVTYPDIRVQSFDTGNDALVVPWVSGSLITEPTHVDHPFPTWLDREDNYLPVSLGAYYDGAKPRSNCFVFTADVGDHYWKDMIFRVQNDSTAGTPGWVGFDFRHVPDDIYDSKQYTTPYAVRLGVIEGDWWDVADAYRFFLDNEVSWYDGPVASPANPMLPGVKDIVAEVLFQPGFDGDHMDLINRQMMDMTRVLGSDVSTIWYQWHAPDTFSHFLLHGYLPARPSLGAAVREAQKQFDHHVSLYYNSSQGADYTAAEPPIVNPTPLQLDVFDAFLIDEDGDPIFGPEPNGPPRMGLLDAGNSWWRSFLPLNLLEIAEFTDMNGIYLDFWLTAPNYGDDASKHAFPPGGGRYMYDEKMGQLADLRTGLGALAPVPDDFVVSMEYVVGRFSEEADIMHVDPAGNLMSANYNPAHPDAEAMSNAVTIPFFRAIYDNIKISRITTAVPTVTGRRAWSVANNVFTFGNIPGLTRPALELIPIFSDRFAIAPFFDFAGIINSLNPFDDVDDEFAGNSQGDVIDPVGTGAGDSETEVPPTPPDVHLGFTVQPKNIFNTPFYEYLGNITTALRGDLPTLGNGAFGLRNWHNGTIRRLPAYTITQVGGTPFDGIPGVEIEPDPETPYLMTPVYTEEFPLPTLGEPYPNAIGPALVPGMFQAPEDAPGGDANSLAFVVTNPWVDPTQSGVFEIDFSIDPTQYPRWHDGQNYTVVRYDAGGAAPLSLGVQTGVFQHTEVVTAGEISWFVLRQ